MKITLFVTACMMALAAAPTSTGHSTTVLPTTTTAESTTVGSTTAETTTAGATTTGQPTTSATTAAPTSTGHSTTVLHTTTTAESTTVGSTTAGSTTAESTTTGQPTTSATPAAPTSTGSSTTVLHTTTTAESTTAGSTTTGPPTTSQTPVCRPVDVVIVVDRSGSMGSSFHTVVIPFINQIVDKMPVDEGVARIGSVLFQSFATLYFNLGAHSTRSAVIAKWSEPITVGGGTDIAAGINIGCGLFNGAPNQPAANIMIVITDGISSGNPGGAADICRVTKNAIVFAVGLGSSVNMAQINAIANTHPTIPGYYVITAAMNYTDIISKVPDIVNDICKEEGPSTAEPSTATTAEPTTASQPTTTESTATAVLCGYTTCPRECCCNMCRPQPKRNIDLVIYDGPNVCVLQTNVDVNECRGDCSPFQNCTTVINLNVGTLVYKCYEHETNETYLFTLFKISTDIQCKCD